MYVAPFILAPCVTCRIFIGAAWISALLGKAEQICCATKNVVDFLFFLRFAYEGRMFSGINSIGAA
jgi:hypothetical protein